MLPSNVADGVPTAGAKALQSRSSSAPPKSPSWSSCNASTSATVRKRGSTQGRHIASLRKVCSWAASVRACARAILPSRAPSARTGVTINRSPSVDTSSSASAVTPRRSSTGLSMMMPELLPTVWRR